MSEHTEQEDLEILAKSDLLVPDSLTMRELADHFMELWGEHLADTQAMYEFRNVRGHVEVYDNRGQFLFSADNEKEAREELEEG